MEPKLEHFSEFKEILSAYHTSEQAKEVLSKVKLVLLIAPTSVGKNTIIRRLLKQDKYYFVISDTTRPQRINDGVMEQNGREYWFRTEEEMLADLKNGEYLEAEIIHNQQVSGISIRELSKAVDADKVAINDVEIEGIHNVMAAKADTLPIMLLPPNYDEWQRRLSSRGRMSPVELRRRLESAKKIFDDGLRQDYYHFVITEDVEQSSQIIDAIVANKPNPHQGRASGLIHQLQERLQATLDTFDRV